MCVFSLFLKKKPKLHLSSSSLSNPQKKKKKKRKKKKERKILLQCTVPENDFLVSTCTLTWLPRKQENFYSKRRRKNRICGETNKSTLSEHPKRAGPQQDSFGIFNCSLIRKRQNDDSVSRGKQKTEKPSQKSNPWPVFFTSAMRLFEEDGG